MGDVVYLWLSLAPRDCTITALEIIENRDHYDMQSPTYSGAFNDSRVLSSTYQELVDDVVQPGHYAGLMHLYGISSAMCCTLQSYIPTAGAVLRITFVQYLIAFLQPTGSN